MVATIRALKMHGGIDKEHLKEENVAALVAGFANLKRHVRNMQNYQLPVVVAINEFVTDTEAEIQMLEQCCKEIGVPIARTQVWEKGGAGGELLAQQVVTAIDEQPGNYRRLYQNEESLPDKAAKIVKEIYGGSNVVFSSVAQRQLNVFKKNGWHQLPICMAKTQYSFSDDPELLGAPADFSITSVNLYQN